MRREPLTPEKLDADVEKCRQWLDYVKWQAADTKRRYLAGGITKEQYDRECAENLAAMRILVRISGSLLVEAAVFGGGSMGHA